MLCAISAVVPNLTRSSKPLAHLWTPLEPERPPANEQHLRGELLLRARRPVLLLKPFDPGLHVELPLARILMDPTDFQILNQWL